MFEANCHSLRLRGVRFEVSGYTDIHVPLSLLYLYQNYTSNGLKSGCRGKLRELKLQKRLVVMLHKTSGLIQRHVEPSTSFVSDTGILLITSPLRGSECGIHLHFPLIFYCLFTWNLSNYLVKSLVEQKVYTEKFVIILIFFDYE